jgi:hypothetical protein
LEEEELEADSDSKVADSTVSDVLPPAVSSSAVVGMDVDFPPSVVSSSAVVSLQRLRVDSPTPAPTPEEKEEEGDRNPAVSVSDVCALPKVVRFADETTIVVGSSSEEGVADHAIVRVGGSEKAQTAHVPSQSTIDFIDEWISAPHRGFHYRMIRELCTDTPVARMAVAGLLRDFREGPSWITTRRLAQAKEDILESLEAWHEVNARRQT